MDQDVVRVARILQFRIMPGQVLDPRFRGLNKNLRLVTGLAQHALDTKHLVTDGIAIAKRRQHLMDGGRHLTRGASATTTARPPAAPMWPPAPLIALALSGFDAAIIRPLLSFGFRLSTLGFRP